MPPPRNYRFNSNTFGIASHKKIYPIEQDVGIIPGSHHNYLVYNIGRTDVYATVKYGTKVMWHGNLIAITIKPGEKKVLAVNGGPFYVTGLKIANNSDIRAVVHCAVGSDLYPSFETKEPGAFDEHRNKLLKQIFVGGVKYIPYVGTGLSGLLTAFWPENTSQWEKVLEKFKVLVNQNVLHIISGILGGDLRYCKERISVLEQEIKDGIDKENLKSHYMNIAQDLIGFENKFIFGSDIPDYQAVNQFILPLYSMFILMKISFYVIGIRQQNEIGLDSENVRIITTYADRTINGNDGANNYITRMYKERVDNAYTTKLAEDLYDNIMNVRTYIATQGLEYIPIWNNMLANPTNDTNPYNDVISYSTLYGRQSPNTIKESIPEVVPEPLTPKLIDGKRNKITYVEVYIWRIHNGQGAPKIGGMKIYFENGDTHSMGKANSEIQRVDFNDALLSKLEVFGDGALDYMVFHFSDERIINIGTIENPNYKTVFELEDHHIVSFYLSNDKSSLAGQAANMSVSYQLIPK